MSFSAQYSHRSCLLKLCLLTHVDELGFFTLYSMCIDHHWATRWPRILFSHHDNIAHNVDIHITTFQMDWTLLKEFSISLAVISFSTSLTWVVYLTAWAPEAGSLKTETEEQSGASDEGLQWKLIVRMMKFLTVAKKWKSTDARYFSTEIGPIDQRGEDF